MGLVWLACGGKKEQNTLPDHNPVVNVEEATIDQLNVMLEKEPNNPEYLYYRGIRYMDGDDYTLAIQDLSASIAIDSTKAATWFNRGTAKYSLDDFDGALVDYNKAIEIKPTYFEAYYNRGVLFDTQERYEAANADYTKVIELKPDYVNAYYSRGVNYYMMKKRDKACEDFKKSADLGDEEGKKAYQKYCVDQKQ